jgi:hypothetical protein
LSANTLNHADSAAFVAGKGLRTVEYGVPSSNLKTLLLTTAYNVKLICSNHHFVFHTVLTCKFYPSQYSAVHIKQRISSRSGIYYYRLKTQYKYQQLDKTLWLTSKQHVSAVTQPSSGQSRT